MNRFAALDIDEYEEEGNAPDQAERDAQLQEEIKKARAAGLGSDIERLRALQRADFPYAARSERSADGAVKVGEPYKLKSNGRIDIVPPDNAAIWRTLDGRVMRIEDMTDVHLLNAARFMMRKIDEKLTENSRAARWWVSSLKKEANRRGRLL